MKRHFILIILLVCLTLPAFAADREETAYDRVMKTQTIRCGYGTFAPWIYQDLKTGKMDGVSVRLAEALADQLDFKLDWAEETGWGALPTALETGKVDLACSLLWIDPARGKLVAYTRPLFYTPVYAYARADDTRFTGKTQEIDNPGTRIVVQESDVTAALAGRYFPQAKNMALPSSAQTSELLLSVTTGKADVVFSDPVNIEMFNAAQDKKLKKIPLPQPIVIYGNAYAVSIHEPELKEMMDAAVIYLLDTGTVDGIFADFLKDHPGAIIPVRKPYETGE